MLKSFHCEFFFIKFTVPKTSRRDTQKTRKQLCPYLETSKTQMFFLHFGQCLIMLKNAKGDPLSSRKLLNRKLLKKWIYLLTKWNHLRNKVARCPKSCKSFPQFFKNSHQSHRKDTKKVSKVQWCHPKAYENVVPDRKHRNTKYCLGKTFWNKLSSKSHNTEKPERWATGFSATFACIKHVSV